MTIGRTPRTASDGCATIIRADVRDAGELLTLQRAAYVTEARIHGDLELPPLVQTLDPVTSASPTSGSTNDSATPKNGANPLARESLSFI